MIKEGISKLVEGNDLTTQESAQIMKEIMSGETSDAQISAFLTALRMKGETVDEIVSLIRIMKQFAVKIQPNVNGRILDIVGTGGDKIKTVNTSTTAAIIAAGAGANVAKHGNRSFTSRCGSADVLERLGLNLNVDPEKIRISIENFGIGFLFAPKFHPSMKNVALPRKEIGIRTVFNILGPLTNPAGANSQVVGVYDGKLVLPVANVLMKLGLEEVLVVYGLDGLDEISTIGPTSAVWLKDGEITKHIFHPNDFGIEKGKIEEILGQGPDENAKSIFQILNNSNQENKGFKELAIVNAAAGIVLAGVADNLKEGVAIAHESIDSGSAYNKLKSLVKSSEGDISKLEEFESQLS